jgi:diguanylate cyclase (GGDEF)-like protein
VLLLLFALLAIARIALARPRLAARLGASVLAVWWSLFLSTAALWGGVTVLVLADPQPGNAHLVVLICSVAFATAYAHNFPMRWQLALVGIALLYLPGMLLAWWSPDLRGVAIALSVFLIYLLSALRLSRDQYERQLTLEAALLRQRDLYEQQSRTDALTGLDNRREFAFNLERAFGGAQKVCLLMIDIDHFKRINDRHGHAAGDAVLIAFAELLREHFTQSGVRLARLGGEEFGVLLAEIGEDAAEASAIGLCQRLERAPLAPGAQRGVVTVSIGVGQLRLRRHRRPDDFIADVDRSLYRAKEEGRNRVCRIAR